MTIAGLEVEVGRGAGVVDGFRLGLKLVGDRVGTLLGILLGNLVSLCDGALDGFTVG